LLGNSPVKPTTYNEYLLNKKGPSTPGSFMDMYQIKGKTNKQKIAPMPLVVKKQDASPQNTHIEEEAELDLDDEVAEIPLPTEVNDARSHNQEEIGEPMLEEEEIMDTDGYEQDMNNKKKESNAK
jgi:hypothetical protein